MRWISKPNKKTYVEYWGHERRRSLQRRPKESELADARGHAWFPVYVITQQEVKNRKTDNILIPEGTCAFVFYTRLVGDINCDDDACHEKHVVSSRPTHVSDVYLINPLYYSINQIKNILTNQAQQAHNKMLHEWSTDACALVQGIYIPLYSVIKHRSV